MLYFHLLLLISVFVYFLFCVFQNVTDSDSDDDPDKEVNRPDDAVSLDELSDNCNESLYECYPYWLFQMPLIGDYLCVTI